MMYGKLFSVDSISFYGELRLLTWSQLTDPSIQTIHQHHNNMWDNIY